MRRVPWTAALPLFLVLAATSATGDKLYTWTDDKGEWHISQTPPPEGVEVKDVLDYTPPLSP